MDNNNELTIQLSDFNNLTFGIIFIPIAQDRRLTLWSPKMKH